MPAPLDGRRLELWALLSSRVGALRDLVAELDAPQWRVRCEGEGWPVGLVGCHVSLGLRRQARWLELLLAGRGPHRFSWERTNALNAVVARRVITPARPDVLLALDDGLVRWHRLIVRMADADLARVAFRLEGHERSAEWVARVLAVRHVDEHTRSIRAALESSSPSCGG